MGWCSLFNSLLRQLEGSFKTAWRIEWRINKYHISPTYGQSDRVTLLILLELKRVNSASDARSEGTGTVTTEEQSDISGLSRLLLLLLLLLLMLLLSRCLTAIRRCFTFLFSHIGLLALVMGYCILGGLTFEHLERENEIQVMSN